MVIKNLGGHSGCKILLLEEDGFYFVRKISSSIEYNKRLEAQAIKQEKFVGKSVKVPKVINKGYDENNYFFFDMEYIKGITLAKYITKIDVTKIYDIANVIISNIDFSTKRTIKKNIFINKIEDLKNKIESKSEVVNQAFLFLEKYNWHNYPQSDCHGDLTLENIIVKNGELYFIDFLDSFCDSWILDFGKLFQDVECMWSYRLTDNLDMNTRLRLLILKEILLKKISSINKMYVGDLYSALLLNLIRIYPYSKDEKTVSYLDNQVKKVLLILRKECL